MILAVNDSVPLICHHRPDLPFLQRQMSWDALPTEIRFKILEAAAQELTRYADGQDRPVGLAQRT